MAMLLHQEHSFDVLEEVLLQHADADKAVDMKAYMKNRFEFLGIPKPARASLQKPFFEAWKKAELAPQEVMDYAWNKSAREWQYLAMDYALPAKKWLNHKPEQWEFWITEKSWWDSVDTLATQGLGPWLLKEPAMQAVVIEKWRHAPNRWLNRSCLIFQLHYKKATDTELLASLCRQYSGSREFFIQKAIGWALRHYSRTDATWVKEFVASTPLPALSRREALRLL